jgi:hypothetical protein
VVDLSDPSAPSIVGRAPVVGSGSRLVPLPQQQLLSISSAEDSGTYTEHVVLQLFDVSDPTAPVLVAEHIGEPGSSTTASNDARAIGIDLAQARFALPIMSGTFKTSVGVFQLLPEGGFTRLGTAPSPFTPLTSRECLTVLGQPTDAESLASVEADTAQAAAYLVTCDTFTLSPSLLRAHFQGPNVLGIGYSLVDTFAGDALSGPPLGRVTLPGFREYPIRD